MSAARGVVRLAKSSRKIGKGRKDGVKNLISEDKAFAAF